MATAPVRSLAVVDWLALVPVLPPPAQTLAHVGAHTCLYAFGLQGACTHTHTHTEVNQIPAEGSEPEPRLSRVFTATRTRTFRLQPPRCGGAQGSDSTQVIPSPWKPGLHTHLQTGQHC